MGKARQEQMDGIQEQIRLLNLDGPIEKKKVEAFWSQWEKLNADELKERTTSGS